MGVAAFSVIDKANRVKSFEKTFLVANVSSDVVFGMLFLTLSGVNIDFLGWELRWKTYSIEKALRTIRYVKLVGKKKFVAVVLDSKHETFVITLHPSVLPRSMLGLKYLT